ncbi:MAG: ATP-dependent zinc protease [Candidatus Aenigmarchaeota archaeon]|nr:ATP-dependent zinc protease [Candidatus Aenigmarchaeota archaeon]
MRKKIVGLVEKVEVIGKNNIKTLAKFDTGAKTTSIDMKLAAKAKLGPILKTVRIISASKKTGERRIVVKARLRIAGKNINVEANLADRSHSKHKVLLGRGDIKQNFIIDIGKIRSKSRKKSKQHRLGEYS